MTQIDKEAFWHREANTVYLCLPPFWDAQTLHFLDMFTLLASHNQPIICSTYLQSFVKKTIPLSYMSSNIHKDIVENVPRTEYTCAVFQACRYGGYESAFGVTAHLVAASVWFFARDEVPAVEGVSVDSGFSHRAERCNSRDVRVTETVHASMCRWTSLTIRYAGTSQVSRCMRYI